MNTTIHPTGKWLYATQHTRDESATVLADADAKWLISYDDVPEALTAYHTITRDRDWTITPEKQATGTETLVVNYLGA